VSHPRAVKHILSVTIFLLIASVSGAIAWSSEDVSDEQILLSTAAMKRHQSGLLNEDFAFGDLYAQGQLRQIHTPVFLSAMDLVLVPTEFADLALPFRLLTAPMVFIFLCGMYTLLYSQCKSRTASTFIAILSLRIVGVAGIWEWGLGTLESSTPQGLVLAISPWLLYAYVRNRHKTEVVFVFMSIGLCANIAAIPALNLAVVLLFVQLLGNRFRPMAVFTTVASAAACVLGALPYLLFYFALRETVSMRIPLPPASYETARIALDVCRQRILYPQLLSSLLSWLLHLVVLAIPTALLLWRPEPMLRRRIRLWVWISATALVLGLLGQGVSQLVGYGRGSAPLLLDLIQATVWAMPAVYILAAHGVTHLLHLLPKYTGVLQWLCITFLLLWFLPSDNIQPVRHKLYEWTTRFLKEDDKPMRLQELKERQARADEFAAIATWARQNSDPNSVFVTPERGFRMQSRRSVYASPTDVRMVYLLASGLLEHYADRLAEQARWTSMAAPTDATLHEIRTIAQHPPYQGTAPWYLILPVRPLSHTPSIKPIANPNWGRHWRLFQIALPGDVSTPTVK